MSDVSQAEVPDTYLLAVAKVIELAPWHTFQVLTKRAERMRRLLTSKLKFAAGLPNVWWGVSVEDKRYGEPLFFKQWGGVQKSKAGRELEGRTHDAIPAIPVPVVPTTEEQRAALKRAEMLALKFGPIAVHAGTTRLSVQYG